MRMRKHVHVVVNICCHTQPHSLRVHTATLPERPCATATTLSTWRNLKKGSLVTGASSNGSGAAFASAAVGDGVEGPTASGSSGHSQSSGPSWQRATVGWKAQIARRVGSGHLKGPCTVRRSQSAPSSSYTPFSFSHVERSKRCTALTHASTYSPCRSRRHGSTASATPPSHAGDDGAASGLFACRASLTASLPAMYRSVQRRPGAPPPARLSR